MDVLAVIGEGSRGFGKAAESAPQHLQLGKRNLPVTCVFLNQLLGGKHTYACEINNLDVCPFIHNSNLFIPTVTSQCISSYGVSSMIDSDIVRVNNGNNKCSLQVRGLIQTVCDILFKDAYPKQPIENRQLVCK